MNWTIYCLLFVLCYLRCTLADMDSVDEWHLCVKELCGYHHSIQCGEGTEILLYNVKTAHDQTFNLRAFQMFKNACMGRNQCHAISICQSTKLLVSYTCVQESRIMKTCPKESLQQKNGFIQSTKYPSMSIYTSCEWKILVPTGEYVFIRIHDTMASRSSKSCQTGLKVETDAACEGLNFTNDIICNSKNDSKPQNIVACGNVSLRLANKYNKANKYNNNMESKIRFWISFEVKPLSSRNLDYMNDRSWVCEQSETSIIERWQWATSSNTVVKMIQTTTTTTTTKQAPTSPIRPFLEVNKTWDRENTIKPAVKTDDFQLIFGIVAPLLAIILLILVVILYRRLRVENTKTVTAKDAAVQTPVTRRVENVHHGDHMHDPDDPCPSVQEGYSHVADEVPFPEAAKVHGVYGYGGSAAYAEVEESDADNLKPLADKFKFHIARSLPALPGRKSPYYSDEGTTRSRGSGSRASVSSQSDYQKGIYEEIADNFIINTNPSSGPSSVETDSGIESEEKNGVAASRHDPIESTSSTSSGPSTSSSGPVTSSRPSTSSEPVTSPGPSTSSGPATSPGSATSPGPATANPTSSSRNSLNHGNTPIDPSDPKYYSIQMVNVRKTSKDHTGVRENRNQPPEDDVLVLLDNVIYEPFYHTTE